MNGGFVVIAPGWVHSVMRQIDIVFGYGNVADPEKMKSSGKAKVRLELFALKERYVSTDQSNRVDHDGFNDP